MRTPWLSRLLAGLLSWQAAVALCADAPGLSAQERLEQARLRLLEQAMQASTRIDALSWVDAGGRLQEHQSMRQSVQLPALQGAGSQLPVRDLVLEGARPRQDCRSHPHTALHPTLALRAQWPQRLPPAVHQRLQDSVRLHWLAEDGQRPWRMFRASTPVASASTYERLLLTPPAHNSAWNVELRIEPLPMTEPDTARIAWRMAVMQHDNLLLEQRAELALPQRIQPWGAAEWTEAGWHSVNQLLEQWAQLLSQQFACVQPRPEVVAQEGRNWVLNMGSLAGLRVGDEWALVDPAWLPERTFEAGAIEQMVVARVSRVDAMRAELTLIAGEARLPRTGWVAQPMNDPKADLSAVLNPWPVRR